MIQYHKKISNLLYKIIEKNNFVKKDAIKNIVFDFLLNKFKYNKTWKLNGKCINAVSDLH